MAGFADYNIAPDSGFTLDETSAITDIRLRRLNVLIDEATLPSAAYVTHEGTTGFKAIALPMLFYVKFSTGSSAPVKFKPPVLDELLEFAGSNWNEIGSPASRISELWTGKSLEKEFIARLFSESIESVAKLEWAKSRVVEDPDIRGGVPTIRGTRIGVYEAANYLKNDGREFCLSSFPALSLEDLEAAEIYARAIPRKRVPGPGRGLAQLAREGRLRLVDRQAIPVSN